jgi:mono/diheme cytochrome c family protein
VRGARATVLLAAALLAGCASRRPPPEGASGSVIFEYQACAGCHGEGGRGRWLGPPLEGLGEHWTAERLAAFLADPDLACEHDERLHELRRHYPAAMASYGNLSEAQRSVLAQWLLAL